MRYKFLWGVFVLLISTPVLAQEFSPIVIETGKPTPSVVKSGESFKITYRAKFFDTVLIYEDQMQPESLALEKIEVIGLEIDKNPFDRPESDTLGFVNVWDFTYTFRIIQPEKGIYKIPSFNFIWVEKKAGVTIEETRTNEKPREMPTNEVGVGYISSIIKPPPLDIRDEISFVLPIWDGVVLRRVSYGVMVMGTLLFAVIVFRFARHIRKNKSQDTTHEESGVETAGSEVVVSVEPILSLKQTRKVFFRELKKIQNGPKYSIMDLEKKLRLIVRTLLLAELRGTIRASMSANEIYAKLSGLDAKQKKQVGSKHVVMMDLARRLKVYQEDIDLERCSVKLMKEIAELWTVVSHLKFSNRIWSIFFKPILSEGDGTCH